MLKEDRTHGDAMFPFSSYSIEHNKEYDIDDNILVCHWHNELEFLIVTEGKASFQVGTSYYEVQAGEAIFVNSGEIHAGYPIDSSPCSFCAIVFNPNLLYNNTIYDAVQVKFVDPIIKNQYRLPAHISKQNGWEKEVLTLLLKTISVATLKPFTYELLVKSNLYLMFSLLISNNTLCIPQKGYSENNYKTERLKSILEYIHANYNRKITTKELALQQNMSEGHFCRFFKQMVKKTTLDYINYYRINKATRLLENNNMKIIEIAIDVGFNNFSYFIITFKRYMKCTPSEYRKMKN